MADTVDFTGRENVLAAEGFLLRQRPHELPDVDLTEDDEPASTEVAGAMWRRHTLLGKLADELREMDDAGRLEIAKEVVGLKPGTPLEEIFRQEREGMFVPFNQYSFYKDNQDDFADVDLFVRNGWFRDVRNEQEFLAKVAAIRRQTSDQQTIARGGALGKTMGFVAGLADPTTLIPFIGVGAKVGALGRTAIFAGNAAGGAAFDAAVSSQLQETHSWAEAFEGIGTAAVLGGGLGVFAHVLSPSNVLHPRHPKNPLKTKDSPLVTRPLNAERHGPGAASVAEFEAASRIDIAEGQSFGWMDRVSPIGVLMNAASPKARQIMADLFSIPGITTKQNEAGLKTLASAEDVLEAKWLNGWASVKWRLNDAFIQANAELGSGSRVKVAMKEMVSGTGLASNVLSGKEWNLALFRKLRDANYKHPDPVVAKYVDQAYQPVREMLDKFFQKGVDLQVFKETDQLEDYLVQRWVSSKVAENPDKFKSLLYRAFSTKPNDDFLREWYRKEMSKAETAADGSSKTVQPTKDDLDKMVRAFENLSPSDTERLKIMDGWNDFLKGQWVDLAELEAKAWSQEAKLRWTVARLEHKDLRKAETQIKNVDMALIAKEREALDKKIELTHAQRAKVMAEVRLAEMPSADEVSGFSDLLRGRRQGIATAMRQELARIEARVARLQARKAKLDAKAADLEKILAEASNKKKAHRYLLQEARRLHKEAGEKLEATKESARVGRKTESLTETVDRIYMALSDRRKAPMGFLNNTVLDSNRLKHRGIDIPKEMLDDFISAGFLDTDVESLLSAYARDLGGKFALRETFGDIDLKGRLDEIREDYKGLISQAEQAGNAKEAQRLRAEELRVIRSVEAGRDRVLGTYQLGNDPESWLMYTGRMVRYVNFLRFMGGTMVSSLTDLATMSMNYGVFRTLQTAVGSNVIKFAKGMKDHELKTLLYGENSTAFAMTSRQAQLLGVDDMVSRLGTGSGRTRQITSRIESATRFGVEKMSVLNGMNLWNGWLKFTAGQMQMQNIVEAATRLKAGKALSEIEMTDFARLGLDESEIKGLGEMLEKYGTKNDKDLWDINADDWNADLNGVRYREVLQVALRRAMDTAVITPGLGDTPAFMSSAAGRLILQFQSFGFAAMNRYVRNLRYKATHGQALEMMGQMTFAAMMGATAYTIKEGVLKHPSDPKAGLSDKPLTWLYESVDRSGLMAWTMPLWNAGLKLGAPALETAGLGDYFDMPSRYARTSALIGLLGGPTLSLVEDSQRLLSAMSEGDMERTNDAIGRLLPFRNLPVIQATVAAANGEDE